MRRPLRRFAGRRPFGKQVTMNYMELIQRSLRNAWRYKSLWMFGFFVSAVESFGSISWKGDAKEWEWLELSAVTVPAQQEATITSVKNFCENPSLRKLAISATGVHPAVERALKWRAANEKLLHVA